MPRGLNRQGDFRNGSPVTTPIDFGTDITLPHDFGNDVTWQTPDPTHFGNAVTWLPNPAHFGNIISPPFPAPTFTSVTPNHGPTAGGTPISIVGSGFSATGLEVLIGGQPCTGVVASDDNNLSCDSPAGSVGSTDIEILTDGGSVDTPGAWTYDAAPTFTSATPDHGPTAGGTSVAIVGSGFSVPGLEVLIGGQPCTSVVASDDNNLSCDSPAGSVGSTDIEIITDGGSVDTPNAWTYDAAIALVDHTIATGNSFNNPGFTTSAINSTGASLLVLAVNGFQSVGNQEGGVITIMDSLGNVYKSVPNGLTAPSPGIAVFYCVNPVTGSGHTVNVYMSDPGAGGYISLSAWSSTQLILPLGAIANTANTNIVAPFKTPASVGGNTGDLILSYVSGYDGFSGSSALPASIDTGFTIFDSEFASTPAGGGGCAGLACGYLLATNTTPVSPTWTLQAAATGAMVVNIVFAKVTSGGVELVATTKASSSGATTTPAIDTTGANFIVASVQQYANSGQPTFSDNKGNTWHAVPWNNGSDYGKPALYYAYNATVGAGHTFSTSSSDTAICVMVFSGVKSSADPLESANDTAALQSVATYPAAAAITPASAGDLVITATGNIFGTNPLATFLSVDQRNLTTGLTPSNSNDPAGAMAYSIALDDTTALQPTWTGNTSGSDWNRGYNNFAVFAKA